MGMYERRAPLRDPADLNQGDVVANVLRPLPPTGKNLCLVENRNKVRWPLADDALKAPELPKDLRVQVQLERVPLALVLSNSCDNAGGYDLLMVPVRRFKFSEEGRSEPEQWLDISEAATGTASPKFFYLPSSGEFGLERSETVFTEAFPVTHDFLKVNVDKCGDYNLRRVCGLNVDAVRHLQWQWNVFISRNPREDLAWPSDEDLRLKLAWLEQEAPRGGFRRAQLEEERDALRARFPRDGEPAVAPPAADRGPDEPQT